MAVGRGRGNITVCVFVLVVACVCVLVVVGWVIGVITHKQTAYASHQGSHPPPLENSYFQAFPYRADAGGRVREGLTCPTAPTPFIFL